MEKLSSYTKDTICCFTGPRAKNLPWQYKETGVRYLLFRYRLKKHIVKAIKNGYLLFVSGMALGMDMIAADIVLELKEYYPHIKLECAIPCINQCSKWNDESMMHYKNICDEADYVTYVSDTFYYDSCMMKRNQYMIEKSSKIIACHSNREGGTKQTIRFAKNRGLDITVIKP